MTRAFAATALAVASACLLSGGASAHQVTCDESDGDLCYYWSRVMGETLLSDDPEMVGTVTVDLAIDPTGHVSACTVRQSSGNPELDSETCQQLQAYAHYRPALDDAGELTTGHDELTIEWVFHPRDGEAGGDQAVTAP